jgi:Ca2+-binding EF-hand superfamily protein
MGKNRNITREEVFEFMEHYDLDKDGEIDVFEFKNLILKVLSKTKQQ